MARGWINPKFLKPITEIAKSAFENIRSTFAKGWQKNKQPVETSEESDSDLYYEGTDIPKSVSSLDLEKIKYENIFNEAKNRLDNIKSHDLYSPAALTFESEGDFIPLSEIKSHEELLIEATRIRVFLADETSQLDKAKEFTEEANALSKYGEAFNIENRNYRQEGYNPDTGESFTRLDLNREKAAWATFRELKANHASMISDHYGYGRQATQNIVAQIYDELENIPNSELVKYIDTEDGIRTVGVVNDKAHDTLLKRLAIWNNMDLDTLRLRSSHSEGDSGRNFSSTGDTGDYIKKGMVF